MAIHIDYAKVDPSAPRALFDLAKYVGTLEVAPNYRHLIDIRASQINGCAFCIDMHVQEAKKAGETDQRLFGIPAWRDTPFYTDAERAVLALTEHVTLIANHGVPSELDAELREHFSEAEIVHLLMTIIHINSWNRLSISTGKQPAVRN